MTTQTISIDELMKNNIINLVKDHKEHCTKENCGVSLWFVKKLAEKAGIKFNEEETKLFF